jgi:hypothetical protein
MERLHVLDDSKVARVVRRALADWSEVDRRDQDYAATVLDRLAWGSARTELKKEQP